MHFKPKNYNIKRKQYAIINDIKNKIEEDFNLKIYQFILRMQLDF